MNYYLDILSNIIGDAFEKAGFSRDYGKVLESNRPDLCEFQCNGALSCAKQAKMNPMDIVEKVLAEVDKATFVQLEGVRPGFINMSVSEEHLTGYLNQIKNDAKFGLKEVENPKTIVIDYGGPNAAKPLHVGHLRPAVIGESIKRLERFIGHKVIGDVHLGDWGMPMGLIIAELSIRYPEWIYFDESFEGEYPTEPPVSIRELEEIYPFASAKSKEDEEFKKLALKCTKELQEGRRGFRALWKHMIDVSIADLKESFQKLDVEFDLWYGEAYSDKYIPDMVQKMKDDGYAYISNGALVVDVKQDDDKKEMPPCIILKSDGASLYETTDIATIVQRVEDYNPDSILYVVDKRQELHFEQVFRCARKTKLVGDDTELKFIGFGTMNGKDGKPFKTRDGQVMRLKDLFDNVVESMKEKISQNEDLSKEQADSIAQMVGLAAIKFGDLSNQASKDYIFDIDRFTSFEGKTGPYILYTMVRIKSILARYGKSIDEIKNYELVPANLSSEKQLMLQLSKFNAVIESAAAEYAPHKICGYMYDLTNCFNSFYHEKRILDETDEQYQQGLIAMSYMTYDMLSRCVDILGFDVPEKM